MMASWQRKRGGVVKLYPWTLVTDRLGNQQRIANMAATPYRVPYAETWVRSSRAEVPGQQVIDIRRLIIKADLPNVGVWAVAEFDGAEWDITAPPQFHRGTRHTRHWTIDVRRRADRG